MLHYIEGPFNILANNLSRLHHLVTPALIAKGKKLVESAVVSDKEEDEAYFLIKITLVFMTIHFKNALSVT